MKTFTSVINEKLKLSKDIKLSNIEIENIVKEIMTYFRLWQYEDNNFIEVINDWVEKNNIQDIKSIKFVCNIETLRDIEQENKTLGKYAINDYILFNYFLSDKFQDICNEEFNKSTVIYQNKKDYIDIQATKDMICCVGPNGTIYCAKENIL